MESLMMEDAVQAIGQLMKSSKGRNAIRHLLEWFDDDGLALDQHNQEAVFTLLSCVWGPFTGTARDEMRDALDAHEERLSH